MSKSYVMILFFAVCIFFSLFLIFDEQENAMIMGADGKHVSDMYPQYQDHQDPTQPQELNNGDFESQMFERLSINQVKSDENPELVWNSNTGYVDIWNQYYYYAASGEQYAAIAQDYISYDIAQDYSNGQKVRYSFEHAHGGDESNASLVFEIANTNGDILYKSDFYNVYEDQEWQTAQGEYVFNQNVSGIELRINPTELSALNLVDDVKFSNATAPNFTNTVEIDAKKINNHMPTTVNTTITRDDDFSDTTWTNQSLEVILPPGSVIPTKAFATYSDGSTSELTVKPTGPNTFIIEGFKDVYFDEVVISFETVFADADLETAEIIANYKYTSATTVGNNVDYNVYGIDVIEMMDSYKLTFDVTGATNNYVTTTKVITPGVKVTDPKMELTKEGYRFVGWSTSVDGSTGMWNFDTNIMPPRDTTLYAVWEPDTYTVNYDINGGDILTVPDSQQVVTGQYVASPISPFSTTGTFAGWNTSADGTGTTWDFNTMPMPNNDITLYAQWTPFADNQPQSYSVSQAQAPTSTVYIDPNYDGILATGQVYPIGTLINQPTNISRPGYTLVGFSTTPNGETGLWDFSSNILKESGYTLYAQWLPESVVAQNATPEEKEDQFSEATRSEYTVTYVYDGLSDSAVVGYGTYLTMPKVPTKQGYTFTGWKTQTGQKWNFNTDFVSSDIYLYPEYEVNSYDIYYDGFWYGEYEYASTVPKVEAPSIVGYEFVGWSENGVDTFDGTMPDHDVMLTSMWKISEYEVKFMTEEVTTVSVAHNGYIQEPSHEVIPGTEFLGWNTKADGSGIMWNFTTMAVTSDLNLYPIYEDINYVHTFMYEDSTYQVDTKYNQSVNPPVDPVKPGYTFLGWSTSENGTYIVDFDTYLAPDSDVNMYPVWSVNSYTLSYELHGGSQAMRSKTISYGDVLTAPTSPSKKGYSFLGWSYDPLGNERVDFNYDTMPASDTTLYAQWGTKPLSVRFVADGNEIGTYYYEQGDYIDPPDVNLQGYEIVGWTTNLGVGTMWNFEKTPIGQQSLTFNAILKPISYNVNFHYSDTKEVVQVYGYEQPIVLPSVSPPAGYQFVGWSVDGQNPIDPNEYKVQSDVDLYPIYTPVRK